MGTAKYSRREGRGWDATAAPTTRDNYAVTSKSTAPVSLSPPHVHFVVIVAVPTPAVDGTVQVHWKPSSDAKVWVGSVCTVPLLYVIEAEHTGPTWMSCNLDEAFSPMATGEVTKSIHPHASGGVGSGLALLRGDAVGTGFEVLRGDAVGEGAADSATDGSGLAVRLELGLAVASTSVVADSIGVALRDGAFDEPAVTQPETRNTDSNAKTILLT